MADTWEGKERDDTQGDLGVTTERRVGGGGDTSGVGEYSGQRRKGEKM